MVCQHKITFGTEKLFLFQNIPRSGQGKEKEGREGEARELREKWKGREEREEKRSTSLLVECIQRWFSRKFHSNS